jgi:hypothetical protein
MTPRPGPPRSDLRIGDAERERAASRLADHYVEGRLDREEHAERLDRIWAARTHADLEPVFADLPGHPTLAPAAPARPVSQRRLPRLPAPLLVLLVVVGTVAVLTNLPVILAGLAVWFFLVRGCRSRRSSHRW